MSACANRHCYIRELKCIYTTKVKEGLGVVFAVRGFSLKNGAVFGFTSIFTTVFGFENFGGRPFAVSAKKCRRFTVLSHNLGGFAVNIITRIENAKTVYIYIYIYIGGLL